MATPPMQRRFRALAAIALTSSLSLVGLAIVTTLAATPASAATRVIRVTGDAATRNASLAGGWTWEGNDYQQLKDIITNANNFGPNNSGGRGATFQIGTPITPVTAAALANVDVFFASGVSNGYTPLEEAALVAFVNRGGVVIANTNSGNYDVTRAFLGPNDVKVPPAVWEGTSTSTTHRCQDAPSHDCAFGVPYGTYSAGQPEVDPSTGYSAFSAPALAAIDAGAASNPLVNGPFGTVTGVRMWHTTTSFMTPPAGVQVVARLNAPCTPSTLAACRTQSPDPLAYDNNVIEQPVVATVPFGGAFGAGAVVLTADSDIFANHYGAMQAGNEMMAKNLFAWIGDHFLQRFTPLAPVRALDTRSGIGGPSTKLAGGGSRDFSVAGQWGVPADATAVALNVTATREDAPSFLTIYPAGESRPTTSSLNFPANTDIANMVIVKLGAQGKLSMYTESGSLDVIADVIGYWSTGSGSSINSLPAPKRLVDSRSGIGGAAAPIGAGAVRDVVVRGQLGVPTNATAVVLNVTATRATVGGYFTVFPGGGPNPRTSNLNFVAGQNIPNLVVMGLGSNGDINIYNAYGTTDVLVDVLGYFAPTGGAINALSPQRLLDTRQAIGISSTDPIGPNGVVNLQVAGRAGVPSIAKTVVLNVTATGGWGDGYLTVAPEPPSPNDTSNVNFAAGQNIPNLVVVPVGSGGAVRILNVSAGVHVLADVVAWFD